MCYHICALWKMLSYTNNRKRLSVPCYFLAPFDKRKHTGHAHQQAASHASTDSAWRHPAWLPHSSLGFQRPVGRRSYRLTPQATIAQSCGLWLAVFKGKGKGKGFPYSIPSVGSGADPGGRLPSLFARPAVTSPTAEHHCPLAGTKLYCLVTQAHRCKQLA